MELFNLIYFLPAVACAYWTIMFLALKKTARQKILMGCTLVCIAYFIVYGFLMMPETNYDLLCDVDIIGVPLALMTLGMMSVYIDLFITKRPPTIPHMIMLVPGIMYAASLGVLYYIISKENIMALTMAIDRGLPIPPGMDTRTYKAFCFIDQDMTMYISLALFLLLTIECIWVNIKEGYKPGALTRFFFFGKRITPAIFISDFLILLMLLMLPVSLNLHVQIHEYPFLDGCLAVGITIVIMFIGLAEYHSDIKDFTLRNIVHPKEYYEKQLAEARLAEFARSEEIRVETEDNERTYKERKHRELIILFRKLLEVDKIYLDPDINILQVSEKLNIGRTVFSTLVNKNFGKNFRTLINEYRIQYAKKLMLNNLSLSQEQIAFKSGFNDASSFSHKFKEIVGVTPLAWITAEVAKKTKEEAEESE